MIWMLLHADDAPGLWLYRRLRNAGVDVQLVGMDEWFCNRSFVLTMGDVTTGAELTLQDGRCWNLAETQAVMARVQTLPRVGWQRFAPSEQDYVAQEWQAIFLAWADLMPMVFNCPTPMGLNGRNRSVGEWLLLAHRVGFETPPFFYDSDFGLITPPGSVPNRRLELLVYRGRCYGFSDGLPDPITEQAIRLQADSGENLLGISLGLSAAGIVFLEATTHPDLRLGGDRFVEDVLTDLTHDTALWRPERLAPATAA